jgi:hypothetical protein
MPFQIDGIDRIRKGLSDHPVLCLKPLHLAEELTILYGLDDLTRQDIALDQVAF